MSVPETDARSARHCTDHPEERLRFVCVPCDLLVCRDCKLTDHEGHRSVDITKAVGGLDLKLAEHRRRLQERRGVVQAVVGELQGNQGAVAERRQKVEAGIRKRAALLSLWLQQAETSALGSLKAASLEVDNRLDAAMSDLTGRQQEIDAMITSIDAVTSTLGQPTFDPVAALRLERDMRTGRGKGEHLERLTEGLPIYTLSCSLLDDWRSVTERGMRRFIGTAFCSELPKTTPTMCFSPLFRCTKTPGACINAICPLPNGTVWLAYDVCPEDGDQQWVCLYTSDGHCVQRQRLAGRVSMARAQENWVLAVGRHVDPLLLDGEETRRDFQRQDLKRSPVALSKLNARFSLETSGEDRPDTHICKVEARSVLTLSLTSVRHFSVSGRLPQALDVDSTGQFFAVLVLDPPTVKLYSATKPHLLSVYRPKMDNFCPSDVCFHVLEGAESLLVADWFNSAVHVLTYTSGLQFRSFLGEGCPLVSQPTALTVDDDNRLWIGCKGGQVVLGVSTSVVPCYSSQCSDDELDDD